MAAPWIAKQDIYVGFARAHVKGDVVPEENVKRNGWEDLVTREGSKAAAEAQGG